MKREVELGILDELLAQLDEGRNVDAGVMYRNPTASYTCPDIAHFRDALGMEPLELIDP